MNRAELLRLIFGYFIFAAIVVLAALIALGKVSKDSSYGLDFLLGAITLMAGGWTQWAFSKDHKDKDE